MPPSRTERRSSDRYALTEKNRRLRVRVGHCDTYTSNVSASGLQLVYPAMRYPALAKYIADALFVLQLELPDRSVIKARGRAVYTYECGDEYLVGVEFRGFSEEGARSWERYLQRLEQACAEPA